MLMFLSALALITINTDPALGRQQLQIIGQVPPTVPPGALPATSNVLTPEAAIQKLEDLSILKGDQFGAIAPLSKPIPATTFLVTLQRALCIGLRPGTSLPAHALWYESSLIALNPIVPITAVVPRAEVTQGMSRQDAVMYAIQVAMSTRTIRLEAIPAKFPAFADETSIRPNARYAAKLAAYEGLIRIKPDNRFNPTSPLSGADSYVLTATLAQLRRAQAQSIGVTSCL